MVSDSVIEAAKALIRRREWFSIRGKETRKFIREHPEVVAEFMQTGTISQSDFPEHVTRASVLLELNLRARRREASLAVKKWKQQQQQQQSQ